jgi:hypothetical protein
MELAIDKINSFTKLTLDDLYTKNEISTNFNGVFINNYSLGDIPLGLIYKLYNIKSVCKAFGNNLNFINSLQNIRNDYNIVFTTLSIDRIPRYFTDTKFLIDLQNEEEFESFAADLAKEFPVIQRYEYTYTHPVAEKKFMGPSKLNMHDSYKIILISPKCLIVEITSHISGFMLMDTFYNVSQYRFDSEIMYQNGNLVYDTKATFSFSVNFVKESWLKSKIESGGIEENKQYMTQFMLPNIVKALKVIADDYQEEMRDADSESVVNISLDGDINNLDYMENDYVKPVVILEDKLKVIETDCNSEFRTKLYLLLFYVVGGVLFCLADLKNYVEKTNEGMILTLLIINVVIMAFVYITDVEIIQNIKRLF